MEIGELIVSKMSSKATPADEQTYSSLVKGTAEIVPEIALEDMLSGIDSISPELLEKAKKDIQKLIKKTIVNKEGKNQTVYVLPVEADKGSHPTQTHADAMAVYNAKKKYMSKENAKAHIERHFGKEHAEYVSGGAKIEPVVEVQKPKVYDKFDMSDIDLSYDTPVPSRVYNRGVKEEVAKMKVTPPVSPLEYKTKNGSRWELEPKKYFNTIEGQVYDIKDEDLEAELESALNLRNRGLVDIARAEKYWKEVIVPKYGDKKYNRTSQEAYDWSKYMAKNEKAQKANDILIDYLHQRIYEVNHKSEVINHLAELSAKDAESIHKGDIAGYERHVYRDLDAWESGKKDRSTDQIKAAVGRYISTKRIFGRDNVRMPAEVKYHISDLGKAKVDALIEKSKTNKVDINDINIIQEHVFENPLKKAMEGENSKVVLFKYDGKYYLNDGNHRVAAAKLRGDKTVDAVIEDVDAERGSSTSGVVKDGELSDAYSRFLSEHSAFHAGKIRLALDKKYNFDGDVMSVKDKILSMHKAGTLKTRTVQVDKVKPLSRAAYNRMNGRQQDEHEEKVRAGGKVTEYRVGDYDLGKIAYDFAQYLNINA